jgi:hypothetical protein
MASGALPPGLPPIQINDEYYWNGGVVTRPGPRQYTVADLERARDRVERRSAELGARNITRGKLGIGGPFQEIVGQMLASPSTSVDLVGGEASLKWLDTTSR